MSLISLSVLISPSDRLVLQIDLTKSQILIHFHQTTRVNDIIYYEDNLTIFTVHLKQLLWAVFLPFAMLMAQGLSIELCISHEQAWCHGNLVKSLMWTRWFSGAGIGKLRPWGHMWPVKVFNPAHRKKLYYTLPMFYFPCNFHIFSRYMLVAIPLRAQGDCMVSICMYDEQNSQSDV